MLKLSQEGYLDSYPSYHILKVSLESGIINEHLENAFTNDYLEIARIYSQKFKEQQPSPLLFHKIDLTLQAYKEFKFSESHGVFDNVDSLVDMGLQQGLYANYREDRETIQIGLYFYLNLLGIHGLEFVGFTIEQQELLDFELRLFEEIAKRLLQDQPLQETINAPQGLVYFAEYLNSKPEFSILLTQPTSAYQCHTCKPQQALTTGNNHKLCHVCLDKYSEEIPTPQMIRSELHDYLKYMQSHDTNWQLTTVSFERSISH